MKRRRVVAERQQKKELEEEVDDFMQIKFLSVEFQSRLLKEVSGSENGANEDDEPGREIR